MQSLGWSVTSTVVNDTFAVLRAGLADSGPHWGIGIVCGAGINCVGVAPDGRTATGRARIIGMPVFAASCAAA